MIDIVGQNNKGGLEQDGKSSPSENSAQSTPTISLPKGGGAIRGVGEKFAANPVTGMGSMTVPIATSPGRSGFGPQMSLAYNSGNGNGLFGFGWGLSLPNISRKTDKGLPRYRDAEESDVFLLSGAEDLVPVFKQDKNSNWILDTNDKPVYYEMDMEGFRIRRYRPRVEGLFARIERWTSLTDGDVHWRSISPDNILTVYGKDENSRIADPDDKTHIFSWLICETRDDKGNAIIYEYKPEDGAGVELGQANESNRGVLDSALRKANRHIKYIRYGNQEPLLDDKGQRPRFIANEALQNTRWMFEVVFDYGEHDADAPKPGDPGDWFSRNDPFSFHRPGFEVRTYRLCQRVLMFHHFPDEEGVGQDCLVRSTDFAYRDIRGNPTDRRRGHPIASFIASVTQSGYSRVDAGGYSKKSLPPLEFEYSEAIINETVELIDAESTENLPQGIDYLNYQWVDLDGEGLAGVLTEQADGWFYKRNFSANNLVTDPDTKTERTLARFSPVERVAFKPNSALTGGGAQFMDLAGDGQTDLVELEGPLHGFYERTVDEDWEPFRPFASWPNVDTRDPNLKWIDLTGDGRPDLLISEDQAFVWHESLGEAGFGPAQRLQRLFDEEKGPHLIFADITQSIFLADLSGDGLTDIVRIRNGEVCYWPNIGYGYFGSKVTMDNSPWFEASDIFDQRRIRLADIDGSGMTDILYLGHNGVQIYFNQSGNSWSDERLLASFPKTDPVAAIQVIDLLGNGTACLVWSSPLPGNARQPWRYIDLMGGQKPHLLVKSKNNLGAETHVRYAPSTRFYLQDKLDGKPWITKLPFPVHVVESTETIDHISRNRFVTRYAYHHGYFDGVEREFRGFGMVEQWDTEEFASLSLSGSFPTGDNIDAASHVPPVHTKTWFHTGVYLGRERVSNFFAGLLNATDQGEYYREPGLTDAQARQLLLDDTLLPAGLSVEEECEACRALKGAMLRQEVYAEDGTAKAQHPYTVTEQNFTIEVLQPKSGNRHAVFFTHAREAISYHYERNPADPRIQHALTLEVDDYGNVLKQAAIGYGRRMTIRAVNAQGQVQQFPNPGLAGYTASDQATQTTPLLTYTENRVTKAIETSDTHRNPLPCEALTFDLTGYAATGPAGRFQASDLVEPDPAAPERLRHKFVAPEVAYEATATGSQRRRPIEWLRTLYRRDDLGSLLPLGELHPLALPGESFKLAFTPGLLTQVFQRPHASQPSETLLTNPAAVLAGQAGNRGGYLQSQTLKADGRFPASDADDHWWIPSGQSFFSTNPGDSAAAESTQARQHFFLPRRYRDPFGQDAFVDFDANDLLMVETRDALGNRVTVDANDYRVLQPRLVSDPNRNQTEVAFDTLGMVVGTAVMGKPLPALAEGDSLAGFLTDLTQAQLDTFFAAADAHTHAPALLQEATTRIVYDLDRFRRTKQANLNDPTKWQPACAATLARETHARAPLPAQDIRIQLSFSYSDGFDREIQKKIQAEPGPLVEGGPVVNPRWVGSGWTIFNNKGKPVRQYEPFFSATHGFEFGVQVGVSPVLFYDPAERVIATLHPNHTYEKVVFDPWQQSTWDVNDTLKLNPKTDPDVSGFFTRLPDTEYLPAWRERMESSANIDGQNAAKRSLPHAGTPTVAHFDALGRPFLTIADNGFGANGQPQLYATRVQLDIEGNQRTVSDARDRIVMRYDYDLLGNRIHQASMEAGRRWMLNDVTGKPIRAWDDRGFQRRVTYDALHRPLELWVSENGAAEFLAEKTQYGESLPNPELTNHRGKVYQAYDGAGIVTSLAFDFKGNLLHSRRQLLRDYKLTVNWAQNPELEAELFESQTRYDALNRATALTTPDHSIIRPGYNEANLLDRVAVNLRGAAKATVFVGNIDYNAKGQRERIDYGNGVTTNYAYDPDTFRLIRLQTLSAAENAKLQDLYYTYDPAGNITHIEDDAQQSIYFRNRRVEPGNDYTYDALYRLVEATGREHLGQNGGGVVPPKPTSYNDQPRVGLLQPGDGNAMGLYTERYVYDAVGNILALQHRGSDPAQQGWNRTYYYEEASLTEADKAGNRLSRTVVNEQGAQPLPEPYGHDAHGNMTRMPHLQTMDWDFKDQLRASQRQKVNDADAEGVQRQGERTYYVYGATGQRVRKITERQNGSRKHERIYLGGFEIYREFNGSNEVQLERETLHIMDDKQRIALVESRTQGDDGSPKQLIRYQFGNHLGSASLELNEKAQVISYEEYYPYGSSSYQAVSKDIKAAAKRYRYTGMERDEETGFSYHGARYYAPWLGRWVSTEAINRATSICGFMFCRNNPTNYHDLDGADEFRPSHATNWFTGWLLYRNDTPIRDFLTSDRNLKVAQDFSVAVAITYGTFATGGALAGAAPAAGFGAVSSGAIAGAGASSFQLGAESLYQGKTASPVEVAVKISLGAAMGAALSAAAAGGRYSGSRQAQQVATPTAGTASPKPEAPVPKPPSTPVPKPPVSPATTEPFFPPPPPKSNTTPARPPITTNPTTPSVGGGKGSLNSSNIEGVMAGYKYRASQHSIYRGTVEEISERMRAGKFEWDKCVEDPITVDKAGTLMGGHHRVVAARLANVAIPDSVIQTKPTITARDPRPWGNVAVRPGKKPE